MRGSKKAVLGYKSPAPRKSPKISPAGTCRKANVFKGLRKISPISPKSPGCRGCGGLRAYIRTSGNVIFSFFYFIYTYRFAHIPKGEGILGILGINAKKSINMRVCAFGDLGIQAGIYGGPGDIWGSCVCMRATCETRCVIMRKCMRNMIDTQDRGVLR